MARPSPKTSDNREQDIELLRTLVPLHSLPKDSFAELMKDLVIEELKKGALLFKQGDTDHVNLYLLKGEVALLSGDRVADKLKAGSETARFPISPILPRRSSARAAGEVRVARLDSRKISDLLSRVHSVDYQVDDLDDADNNDWMSLLLQSRVLQQVPAANIQRVMMSVDQVDVYAGENVIRQGDPGDFYFMLTAGHAVVQRDVEGQAAPVELAKLGPGNAFGEEALLSDSPRNSTVSMLTDGKVLRLAKDDFVGLIHSPLSHSLEIDEARLKIEQGAIWLDLRTQEEYEENHIPGSINLPIESLRYQASNLATDRHYVLCSNSGGRAVAAAFLLTERGLDVSVLAGGFNALTDEPDSIEAPALELKDEDGLQQRVKIAELRAQELEDRLKKAQVSHQGAESERQQHFVSVKEAVDKARDRIIASEKEKQEALEAQRKAYSEMEALTSNMEKLEGERAALADRMAEIEGLDDKLQKRLQKVERELIVERESAESASSNLNEINQRLSEVMEERELEREEHARKSGELKEQMTVLQLELEQARSDIADVHAQNQENEEAEAQLALEKMTEELALLKTQAVETKKRSKQELDKQAKKQNALIDALQNEAIESSELLARREVELSRLRESLQKNEKTAEDKQLKQEASVTELQGSLDEVLEKNATLEGQLAAGQASLGATDKKLQELQAEHDALSTTDGERSQQLTQLTGELEQLKGEHEKALESQSQQQQEVERLQAESEQSGKDLQSALDEAQKKNTVLEEQLAAGQASLDTTDKKLHELQAERDALSATDGEKSQQLAQLTEEFEQLKSEHEKALESQSGQQQEVERLQALNTGLQAVAEESENGLQTSLAEALERNAVLEGQLSEEQLASKGREDQWQAQQLSFEDKESGLEKLLRNAEERISKGEAELKASEIQLLKVQAECDAFSATDNEKSEQFSLLTGQLEQLKAEHEKVLESQSGLQEENERQRSEAEQFAKELQASLEEATEKIRALEGQLTDEQTVSKEKEDQWQVQQLAFEDQVTALERGLQQAEKQQSKQYGQAEKRVAELEAEQATWQTLEAQQQDELTALHGQLQQAEDQLQSLNAIQVSLDAAETQLAEVLSERDALSVEDDEKSQQLTQLNEQFEQLKVEHEEMLETVSERQQDQQEFSELKTKNNDLQAELEKAVNEKQALDTIHSELLVEYVARQDEVQELRTVMETYVGQIQNAQLNETDGMSALRTELEMVREQAIKDVAQMRDQLANSEQMLKGMQEAGGRDALSVEVMRQEISEVQESLDERQRELVDAEETRQMLEDRLEDANTEIETLRRQLDALAVEADESNFMRGEAENAHDQVKDALLQFKHDAESAKAVDLRDERMLMGNRPLDIEKVAGNGGLLSKLVVLALGAGIGIAVLEVLSFVAGRGEIFSSLLN